MTSFQSRSSLSLLLACFCLCILMGCDPRTAVAPKPIVLNWDVSTGRELSRVGWPATLQGDNWNLEGPGTLHVVWKGGEKRTIDFDGILIWKENGKLKGIRVSLYPGEVDDVYARASQLAKEYGIKDTADLERWYKLAKSGRAHQSDQRNYAMVGSHDFPQPRGISVRPTFQAKLPWYIVIGVGLSDTEPNVGP